MKNPKMADGGHVSDRADFSFVACKTRLKLNIPNIFRKTRAVFVKRHARNICLTI